MAIKNITLGSTDTIIMEAASRTAVFSIIYCNIYSGDIIINVSAYPDTASASATNRIISDYEIPTTDSLIWQSGEKFILDTGDTISGYANVANNVTVTVNYLEF
jgi:hypothetical protein